MIITEADIKDIDEIMKIIDEAKRFLKDSKVNQWQDGYPDEKAFLADIENGRLYVVKEDDRVLAVFAVVDYEETYDVIYEGSWINDDPYIAVHRIAVAASRKGKGVARFIFDELKKEHDHIRVDTHEDNLNMQRCLLHNGFEYRGIIYLKRGSESDSKRLAYEYLK